MARRAPEATRQAAALQASRRMIARGQRPGYRLTRRVAGGWAVDELPWLLVVASSRREAMEAGREAIAAWLEVGPDAFDLET